MRATQERKIDSDQGSAAPSTIAMAMESAPLHDYFVNLGVEAALRRPGCVLIDDNARILHPVRETCALPRREKMSRWDSAGCLPRRSSINDTSPSMMKHRKRSTMYDDLFPFQSSLLRRSRSDSALALSTNSPYEPRFSSSSTDKPIQRPRRQETTSRPTENHEALPTSISDAPKSSLFDSGSSGLDGRRKSSPLPTILCRPLPYEALHTPHPSTVDEDIAIYDLVAQSLEELGCHESSSELSKRSLSPETRLRSCHDCRTQTDLYKASAAPTSHRCSPVPLARSLSVARSA